MSLRRSGPTRHKRQASPRRLAVANAEGVGRGRQLGVNTISVCSATAATPPLAEQSLRLVRRGAAGAAQSGHRQGAQPVVLADSSDRGRLDPRARLQALPCPAPLPGRRAGCASCALTGHCWPLAGPARLGCGGVGLLRTGRATAVRLHHKFRASARRPQQHSGPKRC